MKKLIATLLTLLLTCSPLWASRSFNGSSDYLNSTATIDLSGVNKICVSLWAYSAAEWTNIVMEHSDNYNTNLGGILLYGYGEGSNTMQAAVSGDGGLNAANFTAPSTGAWHHIAFNADKSLSSHELIEVYVDNSSQSLGWALDQDSTDNFGNYTTYFGSRAGSSLFFAIMLAHVAIWLGINCTSGEIASLAAGGCPVTTVTGATPYYWPLAGTTSPEPVGFGAQASPTLTVNGAPAGGSDPTVTSRVTKAPRRGPIIFW